MSWTVELFGYALVAFVGGWALGVCTVLMQQYWRTRHDRVDPGLLPKSEPMPPPRKMATVDWQSSPFVPKRAQPKPQPSAAPKPQRQTTWPSAAKGALTPNPTPAPTPQAPPAPAEPPKEKDSSNKLLPINDWNANARR